MKKRAFLTLRSPSPKKVKCFRQEICNYLLSLSFKQHPVKFPQPNLKVTPLCRSTKFSFAKFTLMFRFIATTLIQ